MGLRYDSMLYQFFTSDGSYQRRQLVLLYHKKLTSFGCPLDDVLVKFVRLQYCQMVLNQESKITLGTRARWLW